MEDFGYDVDEELEERSFKEIAIGESSNVSQWHAMAILNLARMPNLKNDPKSIAVRLNVSPAQVSSAIEQLVAGGFIKRVDDLLQATDGPQQGNDAMADAIAREYHHGMLQAALSKLDTVPAELRDYSAITFPANPEMLSEVRELAMRFKRKVARKMATHNSSEVYACCIQVFPLTT
jgi:uncharacterized protein (TIGR02147 family)